MHGTGGSVVLPFHPRGFDMDGAQTASIWNASSEKALSRLSKPG